MSQSTNDKTFVRAYQSPMAWLVLVCVVLAGLSIDLVTKRLAFEYVTSSPVELDRDTLINKPWFDPIESHDGTEALPWNLLDFHLVLNQGAVFGIGPNQRAFFIIFTVIALVIGLFVFGWLTSARSTIAHFAIGLILAGGLGNLYDRLLIGRVRDFLHMLPDVELPFGWSWPGNQTGEVFPWIFNVADVLLLTGMGLLLIHAMIDDRAENRKAQASKTDSPGQE